MSTIVRDDAIRGGDPRIDGTRITVFDVKHRIIDGGEDPHVVAGEYDLSLADLFYALAYYYEHRDELQSREQESAVRRREGERRTRELLEKAEAGETEVQKESGN